MPFIEHECGRCGGSGGGCGPHSCPNCRGRGAVLEEVHPDPDHEYEVWREMREETEN